MATIRIVLGIICLALFWQFTQPDRRILTAVSNQHFNTKAADSAIRERITGIAHLQLGVLEATGNNDGIAVEAFLKVTGLGKGQPWCAAFISWVFKEAGYPQPRTAWSPALFPLARQTLRPKPADVLGIYSLKLKRIAHCGLIARRQNNWIVSIEGNTNVQGSLEGDGVYRKWRHLKTIARFADWVKVQKRGQP